VNGNNIEQEVGLLEVKHPQRRISQAIVLSGNIGSSSWGNIEGLNILKPCLEPDYEKLSADEMKTGIGLLEMLLPWVYSTRGKVR
jgi:hypothetical protein